MSSSEGRQPGVDDKDKRLKTFKDLDEYVKAQEGTHPIKRLLLANNGMAAAKCISSLRNWCYSTFGNEKEIFIIAMATPEDLAANAEYIRQADQVCHVPGGSNINNYANVSLIVEIAQQFKVDAVWAGWGHASENPRLPSTLAELDIVFVGPPAGPMHALGDKVLSSLIAQSAGVPMIAWNGEDLRVNYKEDGCVKPEVFDEANVSTVEQAMAQIEKIGVPVMIKASEGGGGKGIRLVDDYAKVEAAYRQVQSEVPGSPIFIMRLAERSRHLEVQLLADQYGQAIALSGRDCSVQRRHQKILEEGPPIAARPDVWVKMEQAAVRLAKEVGYVNAGTVEYLYNEEDEFFFLELNPRLQVEHPVTEMITGMNLPAAQLQVAMGIPLHRIPGVRKFYQCDDLYSADKIDFDAVYEEGSGVTNRTHGHTIAARITAENPFNGFQPTSGKITEMNFRSSRNVWGYFSVDSSGGVHEFADSQIGHVFAWAETREEARRNLAMALADMSIRGDIRTTIEYLKDLIEDEEYVNNKFNTAWLDARIKRNVAVSKLDPVTVALVGGVCTAHSRIAAAEAEYSALLERGQLPPPALLSQHTDFQLIFESVKYALHVSRTGETTFRVYCNGTHVDAELRCLADGGFLVLMGGKSHVAYAKDDVGAQRYLIDGQTCLFADEYDPTQMRAQMGGKLLRFLVEEGESLEKGQAFAEVEVMKMNMTLSAEEAGTIHLAKPAGAVLEPGDVICTMVLDDPSTVKKAELYEGTLPVLGDPWPQTLDNMPHQTLERAQAKLDAVMAGYDIEASVIDAALADIAAAMSSPLLPVLEVEGLVSRTKHALPKGLVEHLEKLCKDFRTGDAKRTTADAAAFADNVVREAGRHPKEEVTAVVDVAQDYASGLSRTHARILGRLVEQYVDVEAKFAELELSDAAEKDDVLQELRAQHASDMSRVKALALAHLSRKPRDTLVIRILSQLDSLVRTEEVDRTLRGECAATMQKVAALQGAKATDVALEARQTLIEMERSFEEQLENIVAKLRAIVETNDASAREELITSTDPVLAYLMDVVAHQPAHDEKLRKAAMELYVERVYASYKIVSNSSSSGTGALAADFVFFSEATDSVPMGGPSGSMITSVSSFEDLTSVLASDSLSLAELNRSVSAITEEGARSDAETSSVGMDLENVDFAAGSSTTGSTSMLTAPSAASRPHLARQGSDYKARSESVEGPSNVVPPFVKRPGRLVYFSSVEELKSQLAPAVKALPPQPEDQVVPLAVLHIIVASAPAAQTSEDEVAAQLAGIVGENRDVMTQHGVRRVTFAIVTPKYDAADKHAAIVAGHGGSFFTFRSSSGFEEDRIVRNIETPLAFQLDLQRLSNFNIRLVPIGKSMSRSQTVHIYEAMAKKAPGKSSASATRRYFVRALVRQAERVKLDVGEYDAYPGPERVFVQALQALESVQDESNRSKARKNHIFMNVLSDSAAVDAAYVEGIIRTLHRRYAKRLTAQNVEEFEIRVYAVLAEGAPSMPIRVVASNPTGFALNIETFVEASDPADPRDSIYYSISEGDGGLGGALAAMGLSTHTSDLSAAASADGVGSLHGKPLSTPYPVSDAFDERRARARAAGTTFAYDFPDLFRKSVEFSWREHLSGVRGTDSDGVHAAGSTGPTMPARRALMEAEELVLDDEMEAGNQVAPGLVPGLCLTDRKPGRNSIAMVAWRVTLRTPQYPTGRALVVIANDITVKAGSFGTREDMLFDRASKYARLNGMPRLYIAANSGARIGMADEAKRAFKVKWVDEADPAKGFDYIYVDEDAYHQLGPEGRKSIIAERVEGTDHWRIDAIVGESPDLGVENLRGSGTIAGETARAYEESFTLSYVSGRTVGIGAYLVRLGQRTIQKGSNAPILLTGYQALNSLMGRDVYTSNLQLGGPKVMYANGVSHHSVRHDLEGVMSMVNWLSYIPERRGAPLPLTALVKGDRIERPVEVHPRDFPGGEYDPRLLLCGLQRDDETWAAGFFDRGSWTECLSGWARTVIAGRARLGKIPMGVIISEVRTVEARAPADPAAPDSQERIWNQAGQVWFPDSAFKTAQAINDFNREGLPLMLFANWRGFSGGQRDMFDEVLKYGAYIVDALVSYKQPCFVYIPPFGELRGGAWVVVDPTINADMMEMYSAPEGRGGVLEPSGAVSIKYRHKDVVATAHRVDDKLRALDEQLKLAAPGSDAATEAKRAIAQREKLLTPIFSQIAVHFADLHDRPGRMKAKNVIRAIVPWEESRTYFYNRLQRRLAEMRALDDIAAAGVHTGPAKPDIAAGALGDDGSSAAPSQGDDGPAPASSSDAGSVSAGPASGAAGAPARPTPIELLEAVFSRACNAQTPDWDNDKTVHQWLTSDEGRAALANQLNAMRAEHIASEVVRLGEKDPKAILQGLMNLIGELQATGRHEERDSVVQILRRGVFLLPTNAKP